MIWNTAFLTALLLLLASRANSVTASLSKKAKTLAKNDNIKKLHELSVANLAAMTNAAPRIAIEPGFDTRGILGNNTAFINSYFYSSDSCDQAPYAYSGHVMGDCVLTGDDKKSFIDGCSGPSTSISYTTIIYNSTDCSGDPIEMSSVVLPDGTCNEGENIDDDFFANNYGSTKYACESSKKH
jgi:hypothetical protein